MMRNGFGFGVVLIVLLGGGAIDGGVVAAQPSEELTAEEERQQQIVERFQALLEQSPRRGTALDRVYGHHVERGTLDALVQSYLDRVDADQTDGAAWMILGLIEAQRGQDASAVEAFREAEKHRRDDPLAAYYLGQSLVLVGQPEQAAEAFERAIAREPRRQDLLDIFQALGRVYQRARHNEKALEVWDRLEKLFSDDRRVQEQIATALAEEGQYEEALKRYEALAEATSDPYRQVSFKLEAADLKVRLARTDDALQDLEGLLGRLNPESWLYREVRRKVEDVFLRNGDLAGLSQYYENWIERNPEDVEAMAHLGRALAQQGRVPEAREWFERAIELAPSNRQLRLTLIDQLVQNGDIADAIEQYQELNEVDPNNPDTLRDWGRLILRNREQPEEERKREAAEVWERLLADRPNDPVIATQVADLFRHADMTERALAMYEKAIELAPSNPQYREYLGEYYHALERSEEALTTWREIASGENRNARNLARLAEVFAGFGYREEAVEALGEACTLDPDDFNNQMRYAALLHQVEEFEAALAQLELAETLAETDEEKQSVLQEQIKNYQAAELLDEKIATLQGELDAGENVSVESWHRLALYLEASRKQNEALEAVQAALKLDARSVPVWMVAARLRESSGRVQEAADAYRRLADFDRRYRTEHLTQVAQLEMRLGRHRQALQAGQQLIAAGSGNPDHFQFYAQLCFQLGRMEEGFEALRRAVRVNPSDVQALLTLANALADQFRTDEAIELYWQAFDRATDLDGRLSVVSRLTEMYLRTNQLDRLLERLQREGSESEVQQREVAISLARVHQAAGDFGSARQELERLLVEDSRDTQLLQQLSALTEREGDTESAAEYQRRINEIAPSQEGQVRLAQLYLQIGEIDEAEAIWVRFAEESLDEHRIFQAIDNLLGHAKHETALALTERFLRNDPNHWEALYREGVALAGLDREEEARQRFRTLLALELPDDEQSAQARSRAQSSSRQRGAMPHQHSTARWPAVTMRSSNIHQLLRELKLDPNHIHYSSSTQRSWSPGDFGQARIGALGWLYRFAETEGEHEAFVGAMREAAEAEHADLRSRWDWYYLQFPRQDPRSTYEASRLLVESPDLETRLVYLQSLGFRAAAPNQQSAGAQSDVDQTPPLPEDELQLVLTSFEELKTQQPDWLWGNSQVLSNVFAELKRAGLTEQEETLYRETIDSANDYSAVRGALRLAASRGDLDNVMTLIDRFEQLGGSGSPGPQMLPVHYLMSAIQNRADAQPHADLLRIADRYFASLRAQREQSSRGRGRGGRQSPSHSRQVSFSIRRGSSSQYVRLEYPQSNDYYDSGSIQLLYYAFDAFKQDDLLSDLFQHFREQAEQGTGEERVFAHLALCYLHWWNDDKQAATEQLNLASEAAPRDLELRMELAELQQQQGEPHEALALLDSFEPLDQNTMQRREILALNLAVTIGDIERARKAAERLFGLRLETNLQTQLAQQMHQLGMHDLAEAVLARARRRAGNQVSTLMNLMQQYQRQGDHETAVQVAHQILRQTSPSPSSRGRTTNDAARQQAVGVLARSGQLQGLINQAEAQLERSPESIRLHRLLADYYKAAGQTEKSREVRERLLALRPDDTQLHFEFAREIASAGDQAAAIPLFAKAIKQEPSLFGNNFYEVQRAFQQADKLDELVQLIDEIDLRAMGHYYRVSELVRTVMRTDDQEAKQQGLKLFRKAWEAFPDQRTYLIGNMYDDSFWQLPEVYEFAREAVIPRSEQTRLDPWMGFSGGMSYSSNGRATGVITRLLKAAEEQSKLADLTEECREILEKSPEWAGGKALLAVLEARQGRTESALAHLEELLDKHKNTMSMQARWLIGQELEDYSELRPFVIELYEGGLDEPSYSNREFTYSPARRLIHVYKQDGQREQARELLLQAANQPRSADHHNPGYAEYRQLNDLRTIAQELTELDYQFDAIRLYNRGLSDRAALQAAQRWGRSMEQQLKQGLEKAIDSLDDETWNRALLELTAPVEKQRDETVSESNSAVDLVLLVESPSLKQARVTSLFQSAVEKSAENESLLEEALGNLASLREANGSDLSLAVAEALIVFAQGEPAEVRESTQRLLQLVDEAPLEELPPQSRANARQRAEAAEQLSLWLVARGAWQHEDLREWGDRLANRALEAARRQSDSLWVLAMLREQGQRALDDGDRETAERLWSEMLDLILDDPLGAPGDQTSQVAPPRQLPTRRGTPQTTAAAAPPHPASLGKPAEAGRFFPTRPALMVASTLWSYPYQRAVEILGSGGNRVAPATVERFERAFELAQLAAENQMHDLSLRAVRGALAGGPPIEPVNLQQGGSRQIITTSSNDSSQHREIDRLVELRLFALDQLWSRHEVSPEPVYEALAGVVLPEGRPTEIFLYPRPLNYSGPQQSRNVGRILAAWAVRAGRVDELRKRIEERREQSRAAFSADVLLLEIARATNSVDIINERLPKLHQQLQHDGLAYSAELALHAALPALFTAECGESALPVVELAVEHLSQEANPEPAANLLIELARYRFRQEDAESAKAHLERYLQAFESQNARYSGDYGLRRRRQQLDRVAMEFARGGEVAEALKALGESSDMRVDSRYTRPQLENTLALLGRLVKERPAEERYELLSGWILPTEHRRSIRWLDGFVAQRPLPAEFAQAAGISAEGGVSRRPTAEFAPDMVSLFALLIEAAFETDRIDELAAEIRQLAEEQLEGAPDLDLLIAVVRQDGDVLPRLEKFAQNLQDNMPAYGDRSKPVVLAHYLIARACLQHSDCRPVGDRMLKTLLQQAKHTQNSAIVAQLNSAWATAVTMRHRNVDPQRIAQHGLKHWQPGSQIRASNHATRVVPPWWIAHDGVIHHLAGPELDYLHFAYPLTGTFEVNVDVYDGGWSEGGFSYGGLTLQTLAHNQRGNVFDVAQYRSNARPFPFTNRNDYNRATIQVRPDSVRYLVNNRLLYEETDPSPTSPWLALFSNQWHTPSFRNIRISGNPTIPREVPLIAGDRMDGWSTRFYAESKPERKAMSQDYDPQFARRGGMGMGMFSVSPASEADQAVNPNDFDWAVSDGILYGRRAESFAQRDPIPSRLQYFQPLSDGDTIEYEFLYAPGEYAVSPAIDRLAFLIEPDGVKLHWMTDGPEHEWTRLPLDNAVNVPRYRRGPDQPPLHPGQWNRVRLTLDEETIRLELNDVEIYACPLEPHNDRAFSFFRFKDRTAAQVRSITLRGDWPEQLGEDQLADLAAPADLDFSLQENHIRHALVEENRYRPNATVVYERARRLDPAARYAYLRDWVLPGSAHPRFRLYGHFSTSYPAPPLDDELNQLSEADRQQRRLATGTRLVAPAVLLVETAEELGRLHELAESVENAPAPHAHHRRERHALLAMIYARLGDMTQATEHLNALYPLLTEMPPNTAEQNRWPELVASIDTRTFPELAPAAFSLLDYIVVNQIQPHGAPDAFHRSVRHARGMARLWADAQDKVNAIPVPPKLTHWFPVTHSTAQTRGTGYPPPRWTRKGHSVHHTPGHDRDYLYFQIPLQGEFEVNCQLTSFGWREIYLLYGGTWSGIIHTRKDYELETFGRPLTRETLDSQLNDLGTWYDYRLVVEEGGWTSYVNGHKLHHQRLPSPPDPWLAFVSKSFNESGVRNVRITGNPTIPESLELSRFNDLTGWTAKYYDQEITGDNAAWEKQGELIVGQKIEALSGTNQESVLQYHRPMLEAGEFEYEFFYNPGEVLVHPALDRLTFLLHPEGVRIHWMTDGHHDLEGLPPNNLFEEPENRRGSGKFPLKPNSWNRFKIALAGDTVSLYLNGEEIYQRELEPTNQRNFGLFHYADETEVRVRNVTYRGAWPKELPPLEDQELAALKGDESVTKTASGEPVRFVQNLRGRLPDSRHFSLFRDQDDGQTRPTPQGLRLMLPPDRNNRGALGIGSEFRIRGDFEITVSFKDLQIANPEHDERVGLDLQLIFASEDHGGLYMERNVTQDGDHKLSAVRAFTQPDGNVGYEVHRLPMALSSGKMRIARQADQVSYQYAESDSNDFETFYETNAMTNDIRALRLFGLSKAKNSSIDVLIEEIVIRADALVGLD